jgi:hypothetical protein
MRMPKTPMNAEMCFCAWVYMKSVRTTIIRQSNSIQNSQHTTRDSLVNHGITNYYIIIASVSIVLSRLISSEYIFRPTV